MQLNYLDYAIQYELPYEVYIIKSGADALSYHKPPNDYITPEMYIITQVKLSI